MKLHSVSQRPMLACPSTGSPAGDAILIAWDESSAQSKGLGNLSTGRAAMKEFLEYKHVAFNHGTIA